jgi:AraC-like DNA-binding protein
MTEATVRISALHAWTAAAGLAGAEGPPLADEAEMPLARFVRIAERISEAAGDPWLGWRVGLDFDLERLGDMGRAILAARSLGGALRRIVDYFSLIQDAGEVRLEITGEDAAFSYRILDPDIWPRRQDALFTLGIFARIIRLAAGPAWSEARIVLEADGAAPRPEAGRPPGVRCETDGETNLIRFPAAFLDRPLGAQPRAAPPDHARLARQVALRRRRMPATLRVRIMIFQDMHEGHFNQDDVARALGMSGRTLRRRLAEEGVSFQQLLDECRMRLAAFEFRVRRDVSIAQTALRLGYSEHSTFTRAFSRWSGMPPRSYIRQARIPARPDLGPGPEALNV